MTRRFLLLALLVLSPASLPAQFGSLNNDQQATTNSVTFANALHNPSTIVVVCRTAPNESVVPPTDTAGNTYADIGTYTTGNPDFCGTPIGYLNRPNLNIYAASNTHTTAHDVITCASSSAFSQATEFDGGTTVVDGGICTDGTAAGGGANAIVFTSFNTTADNDLIYASGVTTGGSSFTAGTSPLTYTLTPDAICCFISEYKIWSSHGSIGPTEGYSGGSVDWGGMAVALKGTATVVTDAQIGAFAVGP